MLWASQVAVGNENNLRLQVYGDRGGLTWQQEQPNTLSFARLGEAPQTITRGSPAAAESTLSATRIPAGHPEGYLEAFATIYSEVAQAIRAARDGQPQPAGVMFPTGDDGKAGVAFVEAAVQSSAAGGAWVEL